MVNQQFDARTSMHPTLQGRRHQVQRQGSGQTQPPTRGSGPRCDVDRMWQQLRHRVEGLQSGDRLPGTPQLYDSRQDVIRRYLQDNNVGKARDVARDLSRVNKSAAFMAYELIKAYLLCLGRTDDARRDAEAASRMLQEYRRQVEREQRRRRY